MCVHTRTLLCFQLPSTRNLKWCSPTGRCNTSLNTPALLQRYMEHARVSECSQTGVTCGSCCCQFHSLEGRGLFVGTTARTGYVAPHSGGEPTGGNKTGGPVASGDGIPALSHTNTHKHTHIHTFVSMVVVSIQ